MSKYYFDDVRTLANHLKYKDPKSTPIRLHSTLIMLFVYYYYNTDVEGKPEYLFNGSVLAKNTGVNVKEIVEEFNKHRYSKSYGYEPNEYSFTDSEIDKSVEDLINYLNKMLELYYSDFDLFVMINDMVFCLLDAKEYYNTDRPIPHDLLLESAYKYSEEADV